MLRVATLSVFCFCSCCAIAQVTFVIESLPTATPASDTIYISGSFNQWRPDDPAYMLRRQINGQLSITLPGLSGEHEYKFTRGSWTKVETDRDNQYIGNRSFTSGERKVIYVSIDNWLDLGGAKKMNYLIFYFFACAFQGAGLCFLLLRMQKKDPGKYKALITINIVLIAMLMVAVLHENANQIWQSYFTFFIHIGFFCWAPLILFFILAFTGEKNSRRLFLYFIPAAVAFGCVLIRLLIPGALDFLSGIVSPPVTWANALLIVTGFLWNAIVSTRMILMYPFLTAGSGERDPKASMLYYFFWTTCIALILIPINLGLIIAGFSMSFITDFHVVAIVLSALIFVETYYLWRFPEIIREEKPAPAPLPLEHFNGLVSRLNEFMVQKKPYRNVDLTISELAEMVGTRPHVLSRLINDSYQKNFRDFVNAYRIEEFIRLANSGQYSHYTFLALAQEVGFNSKSTFNLAFKKFTRQSPREYFKTRE